MGSALINQGKPLMLPGGRLLMLYPAVVSATPLTALTLVDYVVGQSLANPGVQRKAGTHTATDPGYADAPVAFTYAGGNPGGVQARVLNKDTPTTVIRDWVTLTDLHLDANGTAGWGRAPGVPAGADYIWEIRDATSGLTSRGTQRWGVGVGILAEGQSNMVQTLSAGSYEDIVPGVTPSINELRYFPTANLAGAVWGPAAGFVAMTNLGGTGISTIGNNYAAENGPLDGGVLNLLRVVGAALKQQYGRKIPVFIIPWTHGSTSLSSWITGGNHYEALFNGTGTFAGPYSFKSAVQYWAGDVEIVAMNQGETEGDQTYAGRMAQVKKYCQLRYDYVAQFGRTPAQLSILLAVMGSYNVGATVPQADTFRKVILDLEAAAPGLGWTKLRAGWTTIDQMPPANNALHIVGESQIVSERRLVQSILHEVVPTLAPSKGLGPRITSIVRNGTTMTATVTVAHDGGTQLAGRSGGAAITGYTASTTVDANGNHTGATVDVSGVVSAGNTLTLTCSQFPCYIHYLHGMTPDVSNSAIDNVVYPSTCINPSTDVRTGLPVVSTPVPFLVT